MGPRPAVSTRLIFTTCLSFVDGARWVHASTRRPARGRVQKYTYSKFTNWRKMTTRLSFYTYRNYTHSTTLYKYGYTVRSDGHYTFSIIRYFRILHLRLFSVCVRSSSVFIFYSLYYHCERRPVQTHSLTPVRFVWRTRDESLVRNSTFSRIWQR
jgi:hypothetical protein